MFRKINSCTTSTFLFSKEYYKEIVLFPIKPRLWFRGMMGVYSVLSFILIPIFWIIAHKRLSDKKEDSAKVKQRFGMPSINRPQGSVVWIHAASIGETRMALTLAHQLLQDHYTLSVLITSQTLSAGGVIPDVPGIIHQMAPFDSVVYVGRFLRHWSPCCAFVLEAERWPNLLYKAFKRRIPLIGINTHISKKSVQHWSILKNFFSEFLTLFSVCFTPSQETKTQLIQASWGRVPVYLAPSLKYICPPLLSSTTPFGVPKAFSIVWSHKQHTFKGRPYWLASCIHSCEIPFILAAQELLLRCIPNLVLILIPRHPHHSILSSLPMLDLDPSYAYWSKQNPVLKETRVYIVDTFGQTHFFYQQALFCVLGGSFSSIGGHNLIEPIAQGCAVIHGAHFHHCTELYSPFIQQGASCLVSNIEQLTEVVQNFLMHPQEAEKQAQKAYRTYCESQDEIQKYINYLSSICGKIIKK